MTHKTEEWHWAGIVLGVLTNAVVFGTCVHVQAVSNTGPIDDKTAALRPVDVSFWAALLFGLPLSWLAWKEGARWVGAAGTVLNILAILQAIVFGFGTALSIMF